MLSLNPKKLNVWELSKKFVSTIYEMKNKFPEENYVL